MISFVNAKINIGLQVVSRRADGYHELKTIFMPVGKSAGTPENPEAFGDMIEVIPRREAEFSVSMMGRKIDCKLEKNLVWRAADLYFRRFATSGFGADIILEKYLPDGAGCGGGSADAAFTMRDLSALDTALNGTKPDFVFRDNGMLREALLTLGADCPFFIENRPMFGEGIGEVLQPVELPVARLWLVLIKPRVSVSTREAFAGITPRDPDFDLRRIATIPVEEWRGVVKNDFEPGVFALHPLLAEIKEELYVRGALYASMSGSGSSLYGIFRDKENAREVRNDFRRRPTIEGSYLLEM